MQIVNSILARGHEGVALSSGFLRRNKMRSKSGKHGNEKNNRSERPYRVGHKSRFQPSRDAVTEGRRRRLAAGRSFNHQRIIN
jgi:hypothetical protein